MTSPDDHQRATALLEQNGMPVGPQQVQISTEQLRDWVAFGLSQGRTTALADLRASVIEAQERSGKGGPKVQCPTCEQTLRKFNPHSMDRSKVELLMEIAHLHQIGHEWIKIQQDSKRIRPEEEAWTLQRDAVHASRLKWFGLLTLKPPRSGEFKLSTLGWAYLRGTAAVPVRIWCREGRVFHKTDEVCRIWEVSGVTYDKSYWDKYAHEQTYNPRI